MSIGPLSLLLALVAAAILLLWLYRLRRRDLRSIELISRHIDHLARDEHGGRLEGGGEPRSPRW